MDPHLPLPSPSCGSLRHTESFGPFLRHMPGRVDHLVTLISVSPELGKLTICADRCSRWSPTTPLPTGRRHDLRLAHHGSRCHDDCRAVDGISAKWHSKFRHLTLRPSDRWLRTFNEMVSVARCASTRPKGWAATNSKWCLVLVHPDSLYRGLTRSSMTEIVNLHV